MVLLLFGSGIAVGQCTVRYRGTECIVLGEHSVVKGTSHRYLKTWLADLDSWARLLLLSYGRISTQGTAFPILASEKNLQEG